MENDDIERAGRLILASKYVVSLTGAGVSVESGIRPFRGPGGLWTEYGEPPMDGYQRFLADPKADWERRIKKEGFIRELYEALSQAKPNPAHYALAERARKLREASARRKEVNKWGNLTRTEAGLYRFDTIDLSESG